MRIPSAFILAVCFGLGAYAQSDQQKAEQVEPPAWAVIDDSLGHVLSLTNEQMKQVQQADETYRTNVQAGDKAALEKRDKDLRAVMMPSQFTQWQEVVRQRREKAKR